MHYTAIPIAINITVSPHRPKLA